VSDARTVPAKKESDAAALVYDVCFHPSHLLPASAAALAKRDPLTAADKSALLGTVATVVEPPEELCDYILDFLQSSGGQGEDEQTPFEAYSILKVKGNYKGARHPLLVAKEDISVKPKAKASRRLSLIRGNDSNNRLAISKYRNLDTPFVKGVVSSAHDGIFKTGHVLKQGGGGALGGLYHPWQDRWLEVRESALVYYDKESLSRYKGHVSLQDTAVVVVGGEMAAGDKDTVVLEVLSGVEAGVQLSADALHEV